MRIALFFVAIFFLSQSGHWVRWSQSPPEVLGFWRLLVASVLIAAWNFRDLHFFSTIQKTSRRSLYFALAAGVLFFAHLWAFKYQSHHTSIANGMILFASNPLFTALASMLFFKEKLTTKLLIAYALALAGIFNLVAHQLKFEPQNLDGDLAAIAAAIFYSAYILTSQQARKEMSNNDFSLILFPIAGICFLGLGWVREIPMMPTTIESWIAIFGLAVFSTILGHGLFTYLLKFMNINVMSCGKLLEPVLAAMTAWVLFAEEINVTMIVSFALTASSVLVLFYKPNPKKT